MKSIFTCWLVVVCTLAGCATESGKDTVELKRCDDMNEYYYCSYDKICCQGECRAIDDENCGECNRSCDENEICSVQNDGSWNCNCKATNNICTQTCCADGCVELANNSNHCGACGIACSDGAVCLDGSCKCVGNMSNCDGECVDVSTSLKNCGACGNECPDYVNADFHLATSYCSGGRCYTVCESGFTNRDGDISNGCEYSSYYCGNGVIEPGELCDGYALNMQTCKTVLGDNYAGMLHCQSDCRGFDTSECVPLDSSAVCGNNIAEEGELCDGTDLKGKTCASIFGAESSGTPACVNCTTVDVGSCTNTGTTMPAECTDGDFRCSGQVLQNCSAGKWSDYQTCPQNCDSAQKKCIGNETCSGGEYRCNGKVLEICASNAWSTVDNCSSICDAGLKKCIQCKVDADCASGNRCNSEYSCEPAGSVPSGYETIFELSSGFSKPDKDSNPAVIESDGSTFTTKLISGNGINVGPWGTDSEPDFDSKYIKISLDSGAISKLSDKSQAAMTFYYGTNGKLGANAKIAVAFYADSVRVGNYCSYTLSGASQFDNLSSPCEVALSGNKNIHLRIVAYGASSASSGTVRLYPPVVVQAK